MSDLEVERLVQDLQDRVSRLETANQALVEYLMNAATAEAKARRSWVETGETAREGIENVMRALAEVAPSSSSRRISTASSGEAHHTAPAQSVRTFRPPSVDAAMSQERSPSGQRSSQQPGGQANPGLVIRSATATAFPPTSSQVGGGGGADVARAQPSGLSESWLVALTRAWNQEVDPFDDAQRTRTERLKAELARLGVPGPFNSSKNRLFGAYVQLEVPSRRTTFVMPAGDILGSTTPKAEELLMQPDGSPVIVGVRYALATIGLLQEPATSDDDFHAGLVKRKCCVVPRS